ncbi:AsmA family protein [Parvularcula marina]|uniref:AsmA family protein n=1 Tax=Parvularcula marina TaxID=2292771 RepID=UPI003512841F
MKKILIGLGALIALLVIAVLVIPMFLPASVYKDKIEAAASEALGREVRIGGATNVSIFPAHVTVTGLTVANAEGYEAEYFASVSEADIGVKLLPLLSKRVEITKFHLKEPIIRLEAGADGGNWIMGGAPAAEPTPESTGGQGGLNDVHLGDVQLTDGEVTYKGTDGKVWTATDANLTLTLDSLSEPLGLKGTMVVQGEPSSVEASFTTPRRYAEEGAADMALNMTVGENKADMKLALTDELAFNGDLDIDFPALRSLFALAGAKLGTDQGFERLRLDGPVSGTTSRLAFGQGTELEFDDIKGTGNVTIDVSGARPNITGNLDLGTLNLIPYLPPEPEELAAVKSGDAKSFPAWSEEPMDFSALGAVDTDLSVKTDKVILPSLEIGESDLNMRARNGDVLVNVNQTSLYGGTGKGTVRMNVAGTPRIDMNMALSGVNAGTVAKEVAGITRLNGIGDISLTNLSASGRSQAELVRNLNGDISLDLNDGIIKGINLGKIGRSAMQTYDQLTGEGGGLNAANALTAFDAIINQARGPAEETDFSDLLLGLTARNGVVTAQRLSLAGPYFEISGDGEVNLPNQTMRISLTPVISAEGTELRRALPVPIQVSGSFNQPKVGIDAQSIINRAVQDRLGGALGKAGVEVAPGQSVEDALRGRAEEELRNRLFGKDDEGEAADETDGTSEEASSEAKPKSAEEELIETGLGALFGSKKKSEPKAEEADGGN